MAQRNLEIVQAYGKTGQNQKLVAQARDNLNRLKVHETVEPEKVRQMVTELQVQERQAKAEIQMLTKRLEALDQAEQSVRVVLEEAAQTQRQVQTQSQKGIGEKRWCK